MTINRKDALAGLLFISFGLFFITNALMNLSLGTLSRMGPAFFPVLLGGVLVLLGSLVAARSLMTREAGGSPVPWRGLVLVILAPLGFAATVQGAGIVPAFALTTFIAAFASRRMKPVVALLLVAGLTLFCIAVFKYGLGMKFDVLGPWFEG